MHITDKQAAVKDQTNDDLESFANFISFVLS